MHRFQTLGEASPILQDVNGSPASQERRYRVSELAWQMLLTGWVIALLASAGAVFIGEVMGQQPCLLCWYQRVFMFPLAFLLGIACFRSDASAWIYALPLSLLGAAFATYHVLVFYGLVAESLQPCTQAGPSCSDAAMTVFGAVPLPLLSLGAFTVITLCLAIIAKGTR